MSTTCAMCNKDLSKCDTIFAAAGKLYCSRDCGIEDFSYIFTKYADGHFDEAAEEITPEEIGLRRPNDE